MAFKFRNLLSPELRANIDRTSAELVRLHGLPDRFLGREILRLARRARHDNPELLARGEPHRDSYNTALFWDLAPEIAKRLGETDFLPNERRADIAAESDRELRRWTHLCLNHVPSLPTGYKIPSSDEPLDAWELLTHQACNGNPLAIAIDRICPVFAYDREDKLSAGVCEVSSHRGFDPPHLMWEPGMQDYENLTAFGLPAPDPETTLSPMRL